MDKEVSILRRDLGRAESGQGRRYPSELRARVVVWARRRGAAGASWEEIKRELGHKHDTVRRWCIDGGSETRARSIVPVRVVAAPVATRTLSVVSPSGFRVDDLSLSEAAALLRELQ